MQLKAISRLIDTLFFIPLMLRPSAAGGADKIMPGSRFFSLPAEITVKLSTFTLLNVHRSLS